MLILTANRGDHHQKQVINEAREQNSQSRPSDELTGLNTTSGNGQSQDFETVIDVELIQNIIKYNKNT